MRRFVLLLALAGCQRCGAHASGDAATTSVIDASVSVEATIESMLPKELDDTAPFGNDVKRAVCGKKITGTCDILQQASAGKDADGRDLAVVTVRTREPFDGGDYWDPENGVEDREHWVIARKGGEIVARIPIAAEMARTDVGVESSLTVGANELTLAQADVAPSSWNWLPVHTYRLSPPGLLTFSDSEYNSNPEMGGASGNQVDFRDGSGEGSFHCSDRDGTYFPIPSLAQHGIDPARNLGNCAGNVDGTPKHGYMMKGAADKNSGWFRIAHLTALVVEVHDDKFTPSDRLELRYGRMASGMGCGIARDVVQRITIDGTGTSSRPAVLASKRIRDEANVRTFEITFVNPRVVDVWSGIAIDMIDDDGSSTRTLSTAAVGPELGEPAQIRDACISGPSGPVAVPLFKIDAPAAASITPTAGGRIAAVVREWNAATNAHDAARLQKLYADDVELYGTKMTRTNATALKNAAFAAHDRDALGDISVTNNRATFRKTSYFKNKKIISVDGYIEVDASMKIVAEGDTTTDENLALKKERECLVALDALLPRSGALRSVDHDGPRWAVRYFAIRPGSKPEEHQSIITDEYEIDGVKGTILHGGKPMPGDVSACK